MKVIIFGSGQIDNYAICHAYLQGEYKIVACDGGIVHVHALSIMPDYLLGDFDSAPEEIVAYYKTLGVPVKSFPAKKDETDMELGIHFAIEELYADELLIFGGIGSRLDHTLANIQLLAPLLEKNIHAQLIQEKNVVELINKPMVLTGKQGDLVSLLTMTPETTGITLKGFYYPLENYTLKMGSPIGVSNVMLGEQAEIFLEKGILAVIRAKD